ncbi:LacI family transcriptional regulator [Yinghuangia sp. ASG 101]|uniref:LacI family DNA-binding transcriptional regulator n=1 Tax=Yinghuangia sp. ASG 101 TaxID=2896848 RepID=UPI001E333733|nr:LacI family DNA-binding transcriptional regulator [Yinghuangia sp. ASG 101]UGQ13961.1 LacI family transcriptional regulator [Yinghuangia sp. ASG 101]
MSERRVTASDVARSLGVSRATVGFVFDSVRSGLVAPATRERVLAEAERLGYRPHATAQALARGSNRLVLFVLPDWPVGEALRGYLDGAEAELEQAGYTTIAWRRRADAKVRPLWEVLDPDVVVPISGLGEDDLAYFRRPGSPRLYPDHEAAMNPEAMPSFRLGAALQVDHLHELGHTRLAFVGPVNPRIAALVKARAAETRASAERVGCRLVDERLLEGPGEAAVAAVREWRAAGVTGVVANSDVSAAVVVGAALTAGIAVPGELAVIGYGDNPVSRLFVPALSTVRLDEAELGRHIAQRVLRLLGGDRDVAPPPEDEAVVVRRAST